jgi:hypothetical protein
VITLLLGLSELLEALLQAIFGTSVGIVVAFAMTSSALENRPFRALLVMEFENMAETPKQLNVLRQLFEQQLLGHAHCRAEEARSFFQNFLEVHFSLHP